MDWNFNWQGDTLYIDADICIGNAQAFCEALTQLSPKRIELSALSIEDGESMAHVISIIRRLQPICLIAAPQMLAHGLYKIGALASGEITLIVPREDEGQGA